MLGFRYTNFGECLNILRCRAFPTSTPYIQFLVVLKGIISLFSKYIEYLLKRCYPSPTYRGWEIFTLFVKFCHCNTSYYLSFLNILYHLGFLSSLFDSFLCTSSDTSFNSSSNIPILFRSLRLNLCC